ncbi:thiopurine S-methyltransferase isoform X2 [Zootoca vivipara]|uniref:thiopurine S-methyltransferase isoform X2 n=1 Tax=Zootoca vivipara TaxID=8524 RepID=UPI00293BE3F5|nr:thiopurine S-methyltransferase isoform X2 [Zootoca vivipara]
MESSSDACGKDDSAGAKLQESRVLTEEEWLQKWETKNIGFHNEQGHPLADMGHQVIGVEISESALKEFFTEQKLSFSEEAIPGITGKLLKSTTGNISLYCCNIFDFTSAITGKFDAIWDRGSLVAVNPCDRERYSQLILSLMGSRCHCLLVTCLYDPSKHKGPPFYVPDSEVKHLFGKSCDITCLEKVDGLLERPKKWGLDYFWEVLYMLVLK